MELELNSDTELLTSNDVRVELPTSSSSPLHLSSADHPSFSPLLISSEEDVKPDVAVAHEDLKIIGVQSLSANANHIESIAAFRCNSKKKSRIRKKRVPRNTQKCRSDLTKIKIQRTTKSKSVLNSSVNKMPVISLNSDKTCSDLKRRFKLKNCFIKIEKIKVNCQGTYPEKQECAELEAVPITNAVESENTEIISKIKCNTDIQSVNDQDDDDPDEEMNSETLAELERRYNLNEFSYDITIIRDPSKPNSGDGENQKRTRSGRIIKSPAKIRTQEVKGSSALISNDSDGEGDTSNSESSASDSGSDESKTDSDSSFKDFSTGQQKKRIIPRKIPDPRPIRKTDRAGNVIEPRFKCDTCTKQFFTNRELLRHVNSVHTNPEDRPSFKCSHCDKTYTTKSHCRIHEETHDPSYDKNNRFPCPVCDQYFSDKARLRKHTRTAHNIAPSFKCDFTNCNRRFRNYQFLQSHVTTDHLGVRPFSCGICKRDFKTQKSLTLHKIHKHSTSKDHVCCFCGKGYPCAQSLKNHEKRHSPSYVPPVPVPGKSKSDKPKGDKLCNLCGAVLRGKDSMDKHMRLIHDRNPDSDNDDDSLVAPSALQKQFVCKYCEAAFVLQSTMILHQQNEHPEKFQFQCEECKFGAPTMYLMNHHKLTRHSTARNFKCELCGNSFRAPKDLSRHMKAQHPVSKDHKCPECDVAFVYKYKLKEHALKAHRKVLVLYGRKLCETKTKAKGTATTSSIKDHTYGANPSTAFNCEICNRKYASELVLRRHNIKFHGAKKSSGEDDVEDFKCGKCKSVFTCKKNLVYHQKIHDEEYVKKRLTCLECGRTFSSPDAVRKHIEYTHSSKETIN